MSRNVDEINIVDLESTCWKTQNPPDGMVSEIIEIGICTLHLRDLSLSSKRSLMIRPVVSTVSPFCTELTTLTQADVDRGISLNEAFQILRKDYNSKERTWASYGAYDRKMVERDARAKALQYPFGDDHWNIKSLFARARGMNREVGMSQALEILGIPLEGTHHRGADDSWNIGKIIQHMLRMYRTTLNS